MKEKKKVSWKEGIFLAIGLTLFLRLILFVVGYNFAIRFNRLPLTTREMDFSEDIPMDKKDPWYFIVSPLHRFDALWYEEIAKNNYKNQPLTTAFFPLFPWIVGSMAKLFHTTFAVSAFFINTFLTSIVFYLLYHLARMDFDENVAFRTVIIYAFFPASFFLLAPYAEPLLFVFILLSLIFAKRANFLLSVVFASLGAMTKPYAVAIVLPLFVILHQNFPLKKNIFKYFFLSLIPLIFLLVLGYQNFQSTKSVFFALGKGWSMQPAWPHEPLLAQIKMAIKSPYDLPNDVNFIIVLFTVYYLIRSYKKRQWENWLFVLVFFGIFYLYQFKGDQLFSVSRHALIFFPIFMFLGNLKVSKIIEVIYFSSSILLSNMFFIYYTFGFFVA